MTSIDNLFDWVRVNNFFSYKILFIKKFHWQLLELIFKELPRHNRLICKEVCKRWHKLLMERAIFRDDRHIYIKNCVIEPNRSPMSVFLNANNSYDILTIKSDVRYNALGDLYQFVRHIGKNMTEIILVTTPHTSFVKNILVDDTESPLFPKVETINIRNKSTDQAPEIICGILQTIKEVVTKKVDVILDFVAFAPFKNLEHLSTISNVAKINDLDISADRPNTEMESLLNYENLNCQRLTLTYGPQKSPYSFLEALLTKHKNIQDVKLYCSALPPSITFPQITELTLDLFDEIEGEEIAIESLKPLEFLPNLKKLEIENVSGGCGFGHEPVSHSKLEEFDVVWFWPCRECLNALAKSFINLKSVKIRYQLENLTNKVLRMMMNNWQNIEYLYIEDQVEITFSQN